MELESAQLHCGSHGRGHQHDKGMSKSMHRRDAGPIQASLDNTVSGELTQSHETCVNPSHDLISSHQPAPLPDSVTSALAPWPRARGPLGQTTSNPHSLAWEAAGHHREKMHRHSYACH